MHYVKEENDQYNVYNSFNEKVGVILLDDYEVWFFKETLLQCKYDTDWVNAKVNLLNKKISETIINKEV